MTKKIIGLNLELATIESALNAVRPLVEGSIEDDHFGPREAGAVLALVIARLALIRACIRGEVDPAVAWAEHCATVGAEEAEATEDGDVRLPAWTSTEAIERLEGQLRRLRRAEKQES